MSVVGGIAAEDIASWEGQSDAAIYEHYSACDCCDALMHHSAEYQILPDGRTLCGLCEEKEPEPT